MKSASLGGIAGRIAGEMLSKPGKYKNNTNIIVLPKWYWLTQLLCSIIFGLLLSIPFYYDNIMDDKLSFGFYLAVILIFSISMIVLFLHLILYKVIIEYDHIKIRRLFRYKLCGYNDIYIHYSLSYDFLYYKGKYLTRLAEQLNNLGTLYEAYNKYFKENGLAKPKSMFSHIKQTKVWWVIIVSIQLLITCIMIILYINTKELFWSLLLLEIPVVLLLLYIYVWKIDYDKTTLTYRNMFGITKRYDIKAVKYKAVNEGYKLLYNGKKICLIWEIQDTLSLFSKIRNIDSKDYSSKNKKVKRKNKR